MAYENEEMPEIYRQMLGRGVFVPEGAPDPKNPFYDPYIDGDEEEPEPDPKEDTISATSGFSMSADYLIESVDPILGRGGRRDVLPVKRSIKIPNPLSIIVPRLPFYARSLPASFRYEGLQYQTQAAYSPNETLEREKQWEIPHHWQDDVTTDPRERFASTGLMRTSQAARNMIRTEFYHNRMLEHMCVGIARWNDALAVFAPGRTDLKDPKAYHLIAFRASVNRATSNLEFDDPIREALDQYYSATPLGDRFDPVMGITFEGKFIPRSQSTAEFRTISLNIPLNVTDRQAFIANQRINAAQYLCPVSPGVPTLLERSLHPEVSRFLLR